MTLSDLSSNTALVFAMLAFSISTFLAAWVWFRRPGQRFFVFHPIWRASEALTPLGVRLWWASYTVGLLTALLLLFDRLQ